MDHCVWISQQFKQQKSYLLVRCHCLNSLTALCNKTGLQTKITWQPAKAVNSKWVTWCFMPSQPVWLYQGERLWINTVLGLQSLNKYNIFLCGKVRWSPSVWILYNTWMVESAHFHCCTQPVEQCPFLWERQSGAQGKLLKQSKKNWRPPLPVLRKLDLLKLCQWCVCVCVCVWYVCARVCKCSKLAVATWTYSHSTNCCHHQQTHFHTAPAPVAQFLWLLFIKLHAIYIVLQNMASFTLSFRTWQPLLCPLKLFYFVLQNMVSFTLSFRTWYHLLCPSEHGSLYFVLQNMAAFTLSFRTWHALLCHSEHGSLYFCLQSMAFFTLSFRTWHPLLFALQNMTASFINVKVLLHLKKCVADRSRKRVLLISPYNNKYTKQNNTLKSPNGRTPQWKLSFEICSEIFLSMFPCMYVNHHQRPLLFYDHFCLIFRAALKGVNTHTHTHKNKS